MGQVSATLLLGRRPSAWYCALALLASCSQRETGSSPECVAAPGRMMTVAVAPVMNFSGQFELDPIKVADLLASELTSLEGVTVLPVNRVVAYLGSTGRQQIESPAHALAVAEAVGADAILVAGVTEYDAYTPVVGIALQMYARPAAAPPMLDAVQTSRAAQPASVRQMAQAMEPCGQVQAVFNGTHEEVTDAVKRYAKGRSEEESPFGWKQYLKVQTLFIRFCWHEAIDRLISQEGWRQARQVAGGGVENPA